MSTRALLALTCLLAALAPHHTVGREQMPDGVLASHRAQSPDQVFVHGRIWTGNPAQQEAQALAVAGDRLIAVGSDAEVLARSGAATRIADLEGRRVLPGFIDAHWHFNPGLTPDLYGADGPDDFSRRLRTLNEQTPGKGWIRSIGWSYTDFADRTPDRRAIDEWISDRPVWLLARDGHMGLANTMALAAAGISRDTPDPVGGRIEHRPDGEPTGELKESAGALIGKLLPALSDSERSAALERVMTAAAQQGITSVHNMAGLPAADLNAIRQSLAAHRLLFRIYTAESMVRHPSERDLARLARLRDSSTSMLRFGLVKGWLDGTIDARTAAMLEPYVGGGTGIPFWPHDTLLRAVAAYDRAGIQVALHACGDRAIRDALDAFAYAASVNGARDRRPRIEHIDIPTAEDLDRLHRLGGIASSQPNFAYPDATNLGNYAVLLGPERMERAQAFASIDAAHLPQPFGSDYPVSPMNVLHALHTAVTRQTEAGDPPKGWYPGQRISLETALMHFTSDGAYASFEEHSKGRLVAGEFADFVVLSDDVLSGSVEKLLTARVVWTVLGGRTTYRAPEIK